MRNRAACTLILISVMCAMAIACSGGSTPTTTDPTDDGGTPHPTATPSPTPTDGGGTPTPTNTVTTIMVRTHRPELQGEVVIDDPGLQSVDMGGEQWYIGLSSVSLESMRRTGKMTPAEIHVSAGTHRAAIFRAGYLSTLVAIEVAGDGRIEVAVPGRDNGAISAIHVPYDDRVGLVVPIAPDLYGSWRIIAPEDRVGMSAIVMSQINGRLRAFPNETSAEETIDALVVIEGYPMEIFLGNQRLFRHAPEESRLYRYDVEGALSDDRKRMDMMWTSRDDGSSQRVILEYERRIRDLAE